MASTHEDAFREIQLSGKQLVFVAMAGLVIAVVIFLFGVQVGRGVLAQRGLPEAADAAPPAEPPLALAAASQPSSEAPVTAGEKLSYAERLASPEPAAERLKESDPPSASARPESGELRRDPAAATSGRGADAPPAPVRSAESRDGRGEPEPVASTEPPGTGFAIQVAALQKRDEADVIVKRLSGKGYPAYVVTPAKGAPVMYRVRVGKFKDRSEADTVAARLEKEEQFKPWVVR